MTQETYQPFEWYTFTNGNFKKTFYCVDVDGEYLMFNRRSGYSLIQCRRATKEEIERAKEEERQAKHHD